MQINIDIKGYGEQGKDKSVIDYVMTNTEYLNNIREMIIDKTKEYATCRLDQQNQDLKINNPITT